MHSSFQGPAPTVARVFFDTKQAMKYIGRSGELTINFCTGCFTIHDGCAPGGCLTWCPPKTLCEQIAELPLVTVACSPVPPSPVEICATFGALPHVTIPC